MKALVLHEWGGPLKLEEVPIPKVGPKEALVKVRACGIGLTLNWLRQGKMGGSVPRIIDHEVAVRVAIQALEIHGGYGITKDFPMEKYVRDAVFFLHSDGTCQAVRARTARCLAEGW